MFCITCHVGNTKVTNSRRHTKRTSVWRRRRCDTCGTVFTTIETVATEGLLLISSGNNSTPFSISRLLMSIAPLLTERSSAPDDSYWLAQTAYEQALATKKRVIAVEDLVHITFMVIERFDASAALKYALDHKLTTLPASRAKRPKLR